jgi:alkylation response protein AidB-like acyl-CoA dehydrogenase
VLDYVLDENVQIHGGNGFVKDYTAERFYRDARVNRIFEGTNEINRLLIPGLLIRRALKGEIGLIPAAKRLQDEVLSPSAASLSVEDGLDADLKTVGALKKVALMVLGTAMQTYGQKLTDEQEILSAAADILIDIYAAESAVLRARAAAGRGDAALHEAAARTFVNDAVQRIQNAATNALAAMTEGDTLRTLMAALRRVLKPTPVNTVALRRLLADATVARDRYIVS